MGIIDIAFNALDVVFAPILSMNGVTSLTIFAVFISFLAILLNLIFTDRETRNKMKDKIDKLNKKFKEARKNEDMDKMQKIQQKQMKAQIENMKNMMKPTLAAFVLIGFFFYWLRGHYGDFSIGIYPISWEGGFLTWYILIAITTSLFLRKVFNLR